MKYTPSVNIEYTEFDEQSYIITQNAKCVIGSIINSFNSGMHSFNIIGSYGTGKSNFILALEHGLKTPTYNFINNIGQFNGYTKFEFLKIVGDYSSIDKCLLKQLPKEHTSSNNLFDNLSSYYTNLQTQGKFLFIVIDEFGKQLEYAAKNNPEKELYILQKLAEFINDKKKNIILLTTLHQNFNSYSKLLSESQRNEWMKVKGRFCEIVFNEPVEQLLYLAASRLEKRKTRLLNTRFKSLFEIAKESNFISPTLEYELAEKLYPMDMFSAQALSLAIQRYGQNERTLFSFLESRGTESLAEFEEHPRKTYSLANVYDYITYTFHSFLSEVNSDSPNWRAMRVAIERAEGVIDVENIPAAVKIIKSIGLLNLFSSANVRLSKENFERYATFSLGVKEAKEIIRQLEQHKIIRFAIYKSQYIITEGTDLNIEHALLEAAGHVPRSRDIVTKLNTHFDLPVEFANATYYRKGTPRPFRYIIAEKAEVIVPTNEVDGYINLVFNSTDSGLEEIKRCSSECKEVNLFVYFRNTDIIIDHLWEIDKLEYLENQIDSKDLVAQKELRSLLFYEKKQLNEAVLASLFTYSDTIAWIYKGIELEVKDKTDFNKLLSAICEEIYHKTPTFINELVNKHKVSSTISSARTKYLERLLANPDFENLGFEKEKFPPEKTIYKTLLQTTGIHKKQFGVYDLHAPSEESFQGLWEACENFMVSSSDKPKKVSELIEILKAKPFKLKQGFLEFWIPTYLIIKKNDYSFFSPKKVYIPTINRDVLEIFQRNPNDFSVKAFNVDGVKLDLFNQYRKIVGAAGDADFTTDSLIETIKPFIGFYNTLNKYTKHTKKLGKSTSVKFRDALAKATDPEKTFFEDLPKALGFKKSNLVDDEEVLKRYVELIQGAIRDLRSCYNDLIDRIEEAIVDTLNLNSKEFNEYQKELTEQYSSIKSHLLTSKQKTFLNRIISKTNDRKAWFESICYVVLDKKLDEMYDDEEEYLIDNLLFLFKDLLKYVDVSKLELSNEDHFYRFELISNEGLSDPQIVKLNAKKESQATLLEEKISTLLSGETDVDMYALLNILKKRIYND